MLVVFAGGGSLGPVTPLLATAQALRRLRPGLRMVWMGTPDGPERSLIEAKGIPFHDFAVVKWPRYRSWSWLWFPGRAWSAYSKARALMHELRPDAVVSMGGFTAVPIIHAAARQGVACFTHQLDLEPGLSNRLVARACVSVTTSFEYEKCPFGRTVNDERLPTPVRYTLKDAPSRQEAAKHFGLDDKRPVVLVFGGGQGSEALNQMMERSLSRWLEWTQVVHVRGRGKRIGNRVRQPAEGIGNKAGGYVGRELLGDREMLLAHALADLEIVRGGMGTLSEIAALQKAAIVVPIPGSHQEANALAFEERGAVVICGQLEAGFADEVMSTARLLVADDKERAAMGARARACLPTDDGEALAQRILTMLTSTKV